MEELKSRATRVLSGESTAPWREWLQGRSVALKASLESLALESKRARESSSRDISAPPSRELPLEVPLPLGSPAPSLQTFTPGSETPDFSVLCVIQLLNCIMPLLGNPPELKPSSAPLCETRVRNAVLPP